MHNKAKATDMAPQIKSEIESLATQVKSATEDIQANTDKQVSGVKASVDAVVTRVDAVEGEINNLKSANDNHKPVELPEELSNLPTEVKSLGTRIDGLEAGSLRPANDNHNTSPVAETIEHDAYQAWADAGYKRGTSTGQIKCKSLTAPFPKGAKAAKAAEVLGDAELGDLATPFYRPGVVEAALQPNGLYQVVQRVPAIVGDTYKYLKESAQSGYGTIRTTLASAVDGDPTAVNECVVTDVEGIEAGMWIRFHLTSSTPRKKITAVTTGTSTLTFATDDLDFDADSGTAVTIETLGATAEESTKPAGYLAVSEQTANLKTLASYVVITRQRLASSPGLASWVEGKLSNRIARTLDWHLIYGDSSETGQLDGFKVNCTEVDWSDGTVGDTKADAVVRASYEIPADDQLYACMHRTDWIDIVTAKTSSSGAYLHDALGPVAIINRPGYRAIGGIQVVLSDACYAGDAVVFSPEASELVSNGSASMDWGYTATQFVDNKITALYEEMLAHAVVNPDLARFVDFDSAPS